MSSQIFDEVNYYSYLIEQNWPEPESDSLNLNESIATENFDHYPKLTPAESLKILEDIYKNNVYVLQNEKWYNLLFNRLKKDIQSGFVSMITIQPSISQKLIRWLYTKLKIFSNGHMFKKVFDDNKMFYETVIGGCYNDVNNKMYIVVKYLDKTILNIGLLKSVLHEYCHYYARMKHMEYIRLFKGMISKFYKTLIQSIDLNFNLNLDKATIQQLHETILKWIFFNTNNYKDNKHNFIKCIEDLAEINDEFTKCYVTLFIYRKTFNKNNAYKVATAILMNAYQSISDAVTANNIMNSNYSYQEFYSADEVVAVMSFYQPNYKPYLQMLESLV